MQCKYRTCERKAMKGWTTCPSHQSAGKSVKQISTTRKAAVKAHTTRATDLLAALDKFESDYAGYLNGKDSDDFSRVKVAIRNAGIMAQLDENPLS